MEKLKILDLFSGIGGFSLGLERTGGFTTEAFCEIDKKAQLVLKKHWPGVKIYDDVKTITGDSLGFTPDIICGGFPCQDISTAGFGRGLSGERSGLWFEYLRIIGNFRPKYVLIENVSVLRSRGLAQVLKGLSEIGYDAEWHCITAASVGAPHRRDRVWILASDSNVFRCDEHNGTEGYPWEESGIAGVPCEHGSPLNGGSFQNPGQTEGTRIDTTPISNPHGSMLQGFQQPQRIIKEIPRSGSNGWWAFEPSVGRVAHGIPGWVDRLKQLGNAVVPQVVEFLGNQILRYHREVLKGETS